MSDTDSLRPLGLLSPSKGRLYPSLEDARQMLPADDKVEELTEILARRDLQL